MVSTYIVEHCTSDARLTSWCVIPSVITELVDYISSNGLDMYIVRICNMRFNDKLNQVNSEGRGSRSSVRANVDACAVDLASGAYIAMTRQALCRLSLVLCA